MTPTPSFYVALCLGMLALCTAAPNKREVRWCAKSEAEYKKCQDLVNTCTHPEINLICVRKSNTDECLSAIEKNVADAICLDGGDVYRASKKPHNLNPIMVENDGTAKEPFTNYYAVAVVSKSSNFMFKDLKNKKSCHTGVGKTAGWNVPLGTLIERNLLEWGGPEKESIEKAASNFFLASCAPGAKESKLCSLCIGQGKNKCSRTNDEPFYNYEGAFRCLKDGAGEVAFIKHNTVPASDADKFELLCPDDRRKPIDEYESCNLAKVPAHAVVTRNSGDKRKDIIDFLLAAQKKSTCKLFSSPHGNDLIFKSSAVGLVPLPAFMDTFLLLGANYFNAITALNQEPRPTVEGKIRWCTQSHLENEKCDDWSVKSGGAIECIMASGSKSRPEECIRKIMEGDADAVTLDGGFLYTAGQCGLVPVFGEYYNKDDLKPCTSQTSKTQGTYFAVAVVKESTDITWKTLRGKESCHTGVGRTAGWNMILGRIANETNDCEMGNFFKKSCAPGADVNSNLCALCVGNKKKLTKENNKCAANNNEIFYGYSGALRCLVETSADVAFVKHTTVFENTDGNNPAEWAKDLKSKGFRLLCPDNTLALPENYKDCNLAEVPAHAVVTRPEKRDSVFKCLANQQSLFGRNGFQKDMFQLFGSTIGKDLLFKDSTQCLVSVNKGTSMDQFLGTSYTSALLHLNKCTKNSDLLAACTFHNH